MVAVVGYVLIGLTVYDFDAPVYEPDGSERIIDERELKGVRYWTRVGAWRFTGYEPGEIIAWFPDRHAAWAYTHVEPVFRPFAAVARRCKGHAYRGESHKDETDDPGVHFCSRARRWKVLDP